MSLDGAVLAALGSGRRWGDLMGWVGGQTDTLLTSMAFRYDRRAKGIDGQGIWAVQWEHWPAFTNVGKMGGRPIWPLEPSMYEVCPVLYTMHTILSAFQKSTTDCRTANTNSAMSIQHRVDLYTS